MTTSEALEELKENNVTPERAIELANIIRANALKEEDSWDSSWSSSNC